MADKPMPQHIVDQRAAAFRDSGIPIGLQKLFAQTLALSSGQLADAFMQLDRLGITLTSAEVAEFLRHYGEAWKQLEDTL